MTSIILPRKLIGQVDRETVELSSEELSGRAEPLVVLGEAGMGKTTLLRRLAQTEGFKLLSAERLALARDPKALVGGAQVVVVDAIDEAIAAQEGEAVDRVVASLEAAGNPRFIIACRVADWRSATATQRISEVYGERPLELHIRPLDTDQAREFLADLLGQTRAEEIVEHFEARGLADWLGNPQTLQMVARVAAEEELPQSTGALFDRYVDLSWDEHSPLKTDTALRKAGREAVLNSIGAAFAALILTGKSALTRLPSHLVGKDYLSVSEAAELPEAGQLDEFLGSRLVTAISPDIFTYQHRRVGEYLGALYLAKKANNPNKRKRLLAMFRERGIVPANLRGLHAWLARDPILALDVITADPMGVVEYADTDDLSIEQGRVMIAALEALAARNPRFLSWREYRIGGLAKPGLLEELRRLITAPATPFSLRLLVLQGIAGSTVARQLAGDLHKIMLDPAQPFGLRSGAAEAFSKLDAVNDWAAIGEDLRTLADGDSTRLAVELIRKRGFAKFTDTQIVEILFAQTGMSLCPVPQQQHERIVGLFFFVKQLPDERLDGLLDVFADYANALVDRNRGYENAEIADIAMELIARRVALGGLGGARLWRWLAPYGEDVGYHESSREVLTKALAKDDPLRQTVQRHVLLELPSDKPIWHLSNRLTYRCSALAVEPGDAVALLGALNPADLQDERWREVVELVRHNGNEGAEVRAAARPFAQRRPDLLHWLDGLATPRIPDWKSKQERKRREERAKQEVKWREHRADFSRDRDKLRAGEYRYILPPAQAYLQLFFDIGHGLPAHERIAQWLGEDLQADAFEGFEAFLRTPNPKPTAQEIAESHAQSKHWHAGHILVAALAERLRKQIGFDDLPAERLVAGLLELQHGLLDRQAEIEGLREALVKALRQRDVWESYLRLLVEPSLRTGRQYIDGLYELMRGESDAGLAVRLAAEWLADYPDMSWEAAEEMIDRLIRSGALDQLRLFVSAPLTKDADKRPIWNVVALLTNFEETSVRLAGVGNQDPSFLWTIRDHIVGERGRDSIKIKPQLLAWIIREFRVSYPRVERPSGVTAGNTNPWDASDCLLGMISKLGSDPSDVAIEELKKLSEAPLDGYSEYLQIVTAEQWAKRADLDYRAPSIPEIVNILNSGPPSSVKDLQAIMLEQLTDVQLRVTSDDVDSWRGFFDDSGAPYDEERCRDYLIGLLRQGIGGIELTPEGHVGDDKEVDIACTVGRSRLPIEVKGQWHRDLWNAADSQLQRLYASDWRADRRGIYLVFWFGPDVPKHKKLRPPPDQMAVPTTPNDLCQALAARSNAARKGGVKIFVLDVTRPS